jgi:superoxide dismutase, Cu-Zn family
MAKEEFMKLSSWLGAFGFVCAGSLVHAAESKTITLKNGKGEAIGSATLTPLAKGVKMEVDVHGLTPGEHAIHFHEKGVCTGPKFESAGGHYSPQKKTHGFDTAGGPHAGDMANFFAAADGSAKVEIVATEVSMGSGSGSLLKPGGTALVIHEKADDYKSQPAGDAAKSNRRPRLLARDPIVHDGLEHVHRQRTLPEDHVVERAHVKRGPQLGAGSLAQFGDLELPDFVSESLSGPGDIPVDFIFRIRFRARNPVAIICERLFAGPAFGVHAGVDHQADGAQHFVRQMPVA